MSDTPRTDEEEMRSVHPYRIIKTSGYAFARQLERERNEYYDQITAMRTVIKEAYDAASVLLENGHHDTCKLLNFAQGKCDCGHERLEIIVLSKLKPFLP